MADGDEIDEEARLLTALEAGVFSLQQCALIIGHLWFVGDMGVRRRIIQLLHQKVGNLSRHKNSSHGFRAISHWQLLC